MIDERFDVVVVGSGAGGGVVASRLSEDERCSVLVLEAGPDYPDEAVSPPGFFSGGSCGGGYPPTPEHDWGYVSEPLPNGRRLPVWRGKVAGGTTMTNGCVWVRGRPSDFGPWAEVGGDTWSWSAFERYYEAVEAEIPPMVYPREVWRPAQQTLAEACLELGFRWADDMNTPDAWGGVVGPWPRNRRNEIRQGSLVTYLRKARARPNFELRDRALVDIVVIDRGRATGVTYVTSRGERRVVGCDHVVLSAGAFGTPSILQRSGIGPANALRSAEVATAIDLPVGVGLLDHPYLVFRVKTNPQHARTGWPTHAMVARAEPWFCSAEPVDEAEGISEIAFGMATHDAPRGEVTIASANPDDPPRIDLGYRGVLAAGVFRSAFEAFAELMETETYRGVGASDVDEGRAAEERLDAILGGMHAVGGCAIGSVVDSDLRVLGVEGLTVVDASVFPAHVSNNPNLTCFAIGESAAKRFLH